LLALSDAAGDLVPAWNGGAKTAGLDPGRDRQRLGDGSEGARPGTVSKTDNVRLEPASLHRRSRRHDLDRLAASVVSKRVAARAPFGRPRRFAAIRRWNSGSPKVMSALTIQRWTSVPGIAGIREALHYRGRVSRRFENGEVL
jgi:hypothetical protein